jgi:hypothetical protein
MHSRSLPQLDCTALPVNGIDSKPCGHAHDDRFTPLGGRFPARILHGLTATSHDTREITDIQKGKGRYEPIAFRASEVVPLSV